MIARLQNSAVVWSWLFNLLRFSSGILLLPLILRLPGADFSYYYILLNLSALVPLLDLGFSASVGRSIGYAMAGATELKSEGLHAIQNAAAKPGPNFTMLWELLESVRHVYRFFALGVLFILGAWGTYTVGLRVAETSDPATTWIAWGVTLASGVVEMYAGWWNVFLRGLNQVLPSTKILAVTMLVKTLVAATLLICGAGLLSVPLAGFVSSFLQRFLSRRLTMRLMAAGPRPAVSKAKTIKLVKILWPGSWRTGCHHLSSYLVAAGSTFLCFKYLGLETYGQYGFSLQVVGLCQAMSFVWIQVKWPLIFQLRAQGNLADLRKVARVRILLLSLSFVVLAGLASTLGPWVLNQLNEMSWTRTPKQMLPVALLALAFLNGFLEMQFSTWGMLIYAENRQPYLWPIVAGNILSVAVIWIGLVGFNAGAPLLMLGPLLVGLTFNYWYWPLYSARLVQFRLREFLFGRHAT